MLYSRSATNKRKYGGSIPITASIAGDQSIWKTPTFDVLDSHSAYILIYSDTVSAGSVGTFTISIAEVTNIGQCKVTQVQPVIAAGRKCVMHCNWSFVSAGALTSISTQFTNTPISGNQSMDEAVGLTLPPYLSSPFGTNTSVANLSLSYPCQKFFFLITSSLMSINLWTSMSYDITFN